MQYIYYLPMSGFFMKCCCEMKGFLSFLILWNLGKKSMSGAQLACELEKRKGSKPSPGTIYPVLKELKKNGAITCDSRKVYSLTKKGKEELKNACGSFHSIFYDVAEMFHNHK
jgi:DNA-binding PadR family transcriptional regulator